MRRGLWSGRHRRRGSRPRARRDGDRRVRRETTAPPGTNVVAGAADPCVNGAADIGETYYPGIGNGGYDVTHYDLNLKYDPRPGILDGKATITAAATQHLCRFNLDLRGLTVTSVKVNGARGDLHPRRPRADHHAAAGALPATGFDGRGRLQRRARPRAARPGRLPGRLELHRVRRVHVDAAAGRRHLVPEQQHAHDKAAFTFTVTIPPTAR